MCIEYQKRGSAPIDKAILNAAYNKHFSFHTDSCFKKATSKDKRSSSRKRKRYGSIKCRARMPDMARQRALVKTVLENATWYTWNGVDKKKHITEIAPRRAPLDELQNVSLPAISESKLTCNSNISLHSAGAIVFYVTKYITKWNQDDDTRDYNKVIETIQRMLSDTDSERAHNDDRKEAQRRILRASFAHNSTNVMGAPMASWLTRHDTRFLFTHKFAWCPLKDLARLLANKPVSYKVKQGAGYAENSAVHYFCRNTSLESLNVFDFYSLYEVVHIMKKNKDDVDEIIPTWHFIHPSLNKDHTNARQGSKLRDEKLLLKLRQWEFYDAAEFDGNILDPNITITNITEHNARLILILFLPH